MGLRKNFLLLSSALLGFSGVTPQLLSAAEAADDTVSLEEVVITAERREATLQRSAVAVTVVGGDDLLAQGITSARDILDSVPGLDLTQSSPSSNFSLRGLGAGGGTNFTDGVVAFNIGGVPISRPWGTVGAFYDLQRVEVLKGPQGTLYGRNATVGAINLVPTRPTQEFGGNVNATVGNYNTFNVGGAINMPLSPTVAARVAFNSNKHDGYLTNGYNDAKNRSVRASLLFEPNDDVSLLFWVDRFVNNSKGPSTINRYMVNNSQEFQFPDNPWFGFAPTGCGDQYVCPSWGQSGGTNINAAFDPLSVVGSDGYWKLTQMIYAAELNWKLGGATLTVVPALLTTDNNFLSYGSGFNFKNRTDADQQSLEARLASNTDGKLRWLVGSIYYNEDQDATQSNFEPNGYQIIRSPNLSDKSWAAFADATYSVTDRFRVNAGLRYTTETKKQDGFTLLEFPQPLPVGAPPIVGPQFTCAPPASFTPGPVTQYGESYPVGTCSVPNAGEAKFNNTTWKVGLEFDLRSESLLYVNARTGHKAGGFYPGLPPNSYKPEELTAYELGSKNRFLDNRLQVNVEVFYWDYKDQQIGLLSNINPAGQSTRPLNIPGYAQGVELDVQWLATPNDMFKLLLLNEEGKYDIFPTTANAAGVVLGGLTNNPRVNMPRWNGTLDYEHYFPLSTGARITAGIKVHGETESNLRPIAASAPGDFRPAFYTSDIDVSYVPEGEKWRVTAYVDNAGDEAVAGTGTSGTISTPIWYRPAAPYNTAGVRYASIDAPRTWGLRFSASF